MLHLMAMAGAWIIQQEAFRWMGVAAILGIMMASQCSYDCANGKTVHSAAGCLECREDPQGLQPNISDCQDCCDVLAASQDGDADPRRTCRQQCQ